MKFLPSLLALGILTNSGFSKEQPLDPALREALKAPLLEHFEGEFDAAEIPIETQIGLFLKNHTVESIQIDSDKAEERFVLFPFRAERAGGYAAVLDRDGKDIWRCLGFLFGGSSRVMKSKHGSFFDLSSCQGTGGGHYSVHTYRFLAGRYQRLSSEKKKLVGH